MRQPKPATERPESRIGRSEPAPRPFTSGRTPAEVAAYWRTHEPDWVRMTIDLAFKQKMGSDAVERCVRRSQAAYERLCHLDEEVGAAVTPPLKCIV